MLRIVFVSAYVPSPIRVRPYQLIKTLAARGHAVTLVCGSTPADAAALSELRQVCAAVIEVPTGAAQLARNALRALPGPLPLQAALSFGPPLLEALRRVVGQAQHAGAPFDVAHLEHLRASALSYALPRTPLVLDAVDSISLLFERTLRGSPSVKSRALALLDLARTRRHEAAYTATADAVIVTSPEDAWALRELARQFGGPRAAPDRISVVPNGVDLGYFAPDDTPRAAATLVFSGKMSYHANIAAALFLGQEIMPLIWAQRPEVQLVVAGSAPAPAVQALAADRRVTVTGYVPDLRPYLRSATVALAPLRYGVGIQNKVLEALACGTPVVAARQAVRALQVQDGVELLTAQHAAEYAGATLRLLADPALQRQMQTAARGYVTQHHSWQSSAALTEAAYATAIG